MLTYGAPAPQLDNKAEIMRALFAIGRASGLRVTGFQWSTYPMSFYWATVEGAAEEPRALLLATDAPIVALSATVPDYFNLRFIDHAAFDAAARAVAAPFQRLTAAALDQPLTRADTEYLVGLGPHMVSNLKYWKPTSVGGVIFNWWD